MSGENANKKETLVEWTGECQQAFEQLKQLCSQTPILAYANYKRPLKLHTDASENGLGAAFYQKQDSGIDQVVVYTSWTLSKSEKNYDAHKLEFLAQKWSVMERSHEYLYGGHFEVFDVEIPFPNFPFPLGFSLFTLPSIHVSMLSKHFRLHISACVPVPIQT